MKLVKQLLQNIFITVGFGTMIFVPMLIVDNGFNDTLKSVLIWIVASILYGLSFELLKIKSKVKLPLHVAICFLVTIAVRYGYSYFTSGTVEILHTFIITIPIFIGVYIALYYFMKIFGNFAI